MISFVVFAVSWTLVSCASPKIYQISDPVDHAETPTWDSRNGILYFVNIVGGEIYRYEYATQNLQHIKIDGGDIAPVIPSKKDPNLLIVGLNRDVVAVRWDGKSAQSQTRVLASVSQQFPQSKFNDGKADKQGRLWIGTMGTGPANQGVLYEVTCGDLKSPLVEQDQLTTGNGLAWNKANNKFFYIDTPTRQVYVYDYDATQGTIKNRRVALDLNQHYDKISTGDPDGMTIDKDDNLWVALWGGAAVIQVNSNTGDILQIVKLPADDVSSVMWGGPNLDILYVTTSRVYLNQDQKQKQPSAGAVFAIEGLGTQGLPMNEVDLLESIDDQTCG